MADQPNSQAYWAKRATGVMAKLDKTDVVITTALLKTLAAAKDEITDDLASIIQRYADDNGLTYQQAKKQAYKTDLSQYAREANDYRQAHDKDPEVLKRLNTDYFASQVSVLDLLRAQIDFAVAKQTVKFNDQFSDYLKQTAAEVDKRMAEGFANSTLNVSAVKSILANEWSGANYSKRVWRSMDQMAAKLKDSITTGFIRGYGTRDTARKLRPFVRDMDNTVKTMKYVTERLVRTESTYVANQAMASRYRKDGVERYEFLAHIDDRTSNICKSLNHKEYLMADYEPGVNAPPMHPHCRSVITPADDQLNKYDKYLKQASEEPESGVAAELSKSNMPDYFGNDLTKKVAAKIDQAPDVIKQQYRAQGKNLYYRDNTDRGPWANANGIHMNPNQVTSKAGAELQTYFHESAHYLDQKPNTIGMLQPSRRVGLKEALNTDMDKYIYGDIPTIESLGKRPRRNSKAYTEWWDKRDAIFSQRQAAEAAFDKKLEQWRKLPAATVSDLSDMIEAANPTRYSKPINGGHGLSYWQKAGNQEQEFFAEVSSELAANPAALELTKEVFPTAYGLYGKISDLIIKRKDLKHID